MSLLSKSSKNILVFLTALISMFSIAALQAEDPPAVTEEGLEIVDDSVWGLVYVLPGADFSGYDSVQILETAVAFRENYRRDMNRGSGSMRITESDLDRIRKKLAEQFGEVFNEVFEEDEYWSVSDAAGEDVLTLRPAIVNLDPTAPDVNNVGRNRTYAENAGEMTLYLEIYDSTTGALLAKGLDRKEDRRSSYMQWQTASANRAAAKRIIQEWATTLRDGLNAAREGRTSE